MIIAEHERFGPMVLQAAAGPDGAMPAQLFCENETNAQRLFGSRSSTPYPKDGINDHVIHGAATVNPAQEGTKATFWYQVTVEPGRNRGTVAAAGTAAAADLSVFGPAFDEVLSQRRAEADAFYAELTPAGTSLEDAMIMRQGFAGMIWESSSTTTTSTAGSPATRLNRPAAGEAVRTQRALGSPGR